MLLVASHVEAWIEIVFAVVRMLEDLGRLPRGRRGLKFICIKEKQKAFMVALEIIEMQPTARFFNKCLHNNRN